MNKCKLCGSTILGKDYIKHRKFNEMLSTKENKVDFTPFCGKCVRNMMNLADSIDAPQERYDWRGCKARLNVDRIKENWGENSKYREFVLKNEGVEFTLKLRKEIPEGDEEFLDKQLINGNYVFEEYDLWDFHVSNLIITKDGKEYKY